MKPDPLVKMANQIAANVPDRNAVAADTAAHLLKFWTPVMVDTLDDHAHTHPESVRADVRAALSILRPEGVKHG